MENIATFDKVTKEKRIRGDLMIRPTHEIIRYVSFLFSPEDSEYEPGDTRKSRVGGMDLLGARPRVDVKAVFWIMASILISIQLARLC